MGYGVPANKNSDVDFSQCRRFPGYLGSGSWNDLNNRKLDCVAAVFLNCCDKFGGLRPRPSDEYANPV
jgi:hypothetical protein